MTAAQPPPLMFRVGPHRNKYHHLAVSPGRGRGDPNEHLWVFQTDLVRDRVRQSAGQGLKWLARRAPVPHNPEDMRELANQATFVFATPDDSIFENMGHRWIRWTDWRGHQWALAADVPDKAGASWMHFKAAPKTSGTEGDKEPGRPEPHCSAEPAKRNGR